MKILGNLTIEKGDKTDYSKLTEVSGYIDVRANATLTVPALTEVSGSIYVSENATLTVPALTKSGSIDVSENATLTVPALTEVSGSIYVSENATLTAPALTVKKNTAKFNKKEFKVMNNDGMCFYSESERTSKGIKIHSGLFRLRIEDSKVIGDSLFLVTKEGFSAHGDTLKSAISDLQFKIVAEKLKNEPIYAETMVSVNHYRTVTGACEIGVKEWKKQNNILADEMPAKELLPLLEKTNAYGMSRFKDLIKF